MPRKQPEPYLIGMFDILGFRAMLTEVGLKPLVSRFLELRRNLELMFKWEVRAVTFSDTILLYSRLPHPSTMMAPQVGLSNAELFCRYAAALQAEALMLGIPLRGGIAWGECSIVPTRGAFVGSAIVDAYLLSETQDWIGVSLHDSCLPIMPLSRSPDRGSKRGIFLQTSVPTKDQPASTMWTLDWPRMTKRPVDLKEALASQVAKNLGTVHAARWQSTQAFFERRFKTLLDPPQPDFTRLIVPVLHRER
jgi:hypothetical protein